MSGGRAGAPGAGTVLMRAGLVAAGGTVGVAARLGLGMVLPDASGIPVSVIVANVAGAFLLGVLTAQLPGGSARLFWGTGVLGGFTTYSAFTVGVTELWGANPVAAFVFAGGSVVVGLVAAWGGLVVGHPRRKADA